MEKELWVYAHYNVYNKETEYQLSSYERAESSGDALLEKRTVIFDTPNDKETRVKLASALGAKLKNLRAEHSKEEGGYQESINELLALEFKPEVAPSPN